MKDNQMKLHTSTLLLVAAALFAGLVALDFSFIKGWGQYEDVIEATASTDVFKTMGSMRFDGGTFTSEDLSGSRITAFNIWETTCPACLGEMGDLEELSKIYPGSEFQLVGICADVYDREGKLKESQIETGKELMENAGVTFTNLIPTPEMHTFFRSSIVGFPTTFFVDSQGNIITTSCGSMKLDDWKKTVEKVMEEQ